MMALFGINDKAPCPYCYERIDPGKVYFRCNGRPAPGRMPCAKAQDDTRLRVLEDATPVLRSFAPVGRTWLRRAEASCPDCYGTTGTRVCPNCHSVLPANFTAESPLIGLVGVRGSGKTVMLSVLSKELTSSVARRFGASIRSVGASQLTNRLEEIRRNLEDGVGTLPEQTAARNATDTVPAVYEWQIERSAMGNSSRTVSTILSFYDTSGEDLATIEKTREQHYLGAADGLILLLDPFGFPENRHTAIARGVDKDALKDAPRDVLQHVTEMLREAERLRPNQKIKRPVAVVLAKVDAFFSQVEVDDPIRRPSSSAPSFDEKESLDLHHHVEAMVSEWGGDDILAMLRLNYTSYRFFVASALGAEPDYKSGKVNSRGVLPHRVAEPLLWLMSLRGFVQKAG